MRNIRWRRCDTVLALSSELEEEEELEEEKVV
jgi:hypothetical protein